MIPGLFYTSCAVKSIAFFAWRVSVLYSPDCNTKFDYVVVSVVISVAIKAIFMLSSRSKHIENKTDRDRNSSTDKRFLSKIG